MSIDIGRFALHTAIRSGSMGEVWAGVHTLDQTPVAIKVIHLPEGDRDLYQASFRRELQSIARLNHPNIIAVFDYGVLPGPLPPTPHGVLRPGNPYLAMEFASGGSLVRNLPQTWGELRHALLAILDALAHAHARGVLHRDLKPGNILVCGERDLRPGLKLADFGIAQSMTGPSPSGEDIMTSLTREMPTGTPSYMAPEQFQGAWRDYGPWTDLYSLGIMTWQIVCRALPFTERSFHELGLSHMQRELPALRPGFEVPHELEGWIRRMTAKSPEARFQRAVDAAWALEEVGMRRAGVGTTAPAPMRSYLETLPQVSRPLGGVLAEDRDLPPITLPPMGSWRVEAEAFAEQPDASSKRLLRRLGGIGQELFGLREIPMVGRHREREALWEALRQVHQRPHARACVIRAQPGQGASRLARWLGERAHEVGAATPMQARHAAYDTIQHGLARMLSDHLRCTGLPQRKMLKRLEQQLRAHGIEDPFAWTRLQMMLRHQGKPDPELSNTRSTTRSLQPDVRYGLLNRLVTQFSHRRPVLIWLDDAQWGLDSLHFAQHLLKHQRPGETRVLLVLTVNDAALEDQAVTRRVLTGLEARPEVSTLTLAPIEPEPFRALVHSLLCLSEPLAQEVIARAHGNPQYAIQLVADWIGRGALKLTEEGFTLLSQAPVVLPDDISAIWTGFLERYLNDSEEGVQIALEVAAALRVEVPGDEFAEACRQMDIQPRWQALDVMVAHRLMERRDDTWVFTRAQVIEYFEGESRRAGRWAQVHLACAEMLAALHSPHHPGIAERRARHLMEASDYTGASDALLLAAQEETEAGGYERAIELLDTRLALLDSLSTPERSLTHGPRRLRGWTARAVALGYNGETDAAEMWAERALTAAQEAGLTEEIAEAQLAQALVCELRGEVERAWDLKTAALDHFITTRQARRAAELLLRMGELMLRSGQLQKALAAFNRAHDHLTTDALIRGEALAGLGHVYRQRLDGRQARKLYQKARACFQRAEEWREDANCVAALGHIFRIEGDFEAAAAFYSEAIQSLQRLHAPEALMVELTLNLLLFQSNRHIEARTRVQKLLPHLNQTIHRSARAVAYVLMLPGDAAARDPGAWSDHLGEAERLLEVTRTIDIDIAQTARLAGDLMHPSHPEYARRAYALAIHHFEILGHTRSAEPLRRRLDDA